MKDIRRLDELPINGHALLYLYTSACCIPTSSLDKLIRKNPTIQFVKSDAGVPSEIDDEYSVSRVPAFMLLNDGILLWSYLGTDIKYLAAQLKAKCGISSDPETPLGER